MLRSVQFLNSGFVRSRSQLKRNLCGAMAAVQGSCDREKAYVRCHPEEENIIITLKLAGKEKRLNRSKLEPLEKSLGRIKVGLLPKQDKQKKKKMKGIVKGGGAAGPLPVEDLRVALYGSPDIDGEPFEDTMSSEMAWSSGRLLVCGNEHYDVILNPPTVEKVSLPNYPMVGFPLLPVCSFAFSDEAACTWRWLRRSSGGPWECLKVFEPKYVPQPSDLGHQLRVECTPGAFNPNGLEESRIKKRRVGEPVAADSASVMNGPPGFSGAGRHEATPAPTQAPDVRVVTYNVLADQYATMDKAMTDLYGYLDPKFLDIYYRQQLVLAELAGFNADIINCQEVDRKVFNQYLHPHMKSLGFTGVYTNKANSVAEGEAMFVRNSRFKIVSTKDVIMRETLRLPLPDSLQMFAPMIEASPDLIQALENVGTVAQIAMLQPVNSTLDNPLLVANTHLFFHPGAGHIRNMQTYAIMDALDKLMKSDEVHEKLGTKFPAVLLCGDLNSNRAGVIKLLTQGMIDSENIEWKDAVHFQWGKDADGEVLGFGAKGETVAKANVGGVDLKLPFKMESALDLKTPYTNYTILYKGLLDYIFYRKEDFSIKQIVPLPNEANLGDGIPSEIYPSDHISVVADLTWRANQGVSPIPATLDQAPTAASYLSNSGVLAIPTDTLYGFAVDASLDCAIKKVYDIKGRSTNIPLAICVAGPSDVPRYCNVEHLPQGLLEALLPGPVTLVLEKKGDAPLSPVLNPGLQTVGVRVPASDFVQSVCAAHRGALALTSANPSGQPSSTDVSDFNGLWSMCTAVYDGGIINASRLGSTVVDLTDANKAKVLRDGSALEATLANLQRFGIKV